MATPATVPLGPPTVPPVPATVPLGPLGLVHGPDAGGLSGLDHLDPGGQSAVVQRPGGPKGRVGLQQPVVGTKQSQQDRAVDQGLPPEIAWLHRGIGTQAVSAAMDFARPADALAQLRPAGIAQVAGAAELGV